MHYHFEGRLTTSDCKQHIPHRFLLPGDSSQIEIHFQFAPNCVHDITNLLTLTIFDPDGFRGAAHRDGNDQRVRINATEATPGYLPGALPAGEWIAQIDTHMVMPGDPVRYSLDISISQGTHSRVEPKPVPFPRVAPIRPRGAAWYRGDLHSHSHHSDANERTVAELVQAARDNQLDFVFLTDHNTTAGLGEMDALTADDLLTAGGMELTTFWGHALCLGTRKWVDWRIRPDTDEIARIADTTYTNDQVFIIAHPQAIGDPICTGCTWRFGNMMPGTARLVEVWNGGWNSRSNNEQALALWYDWLNQGSHLVATAGTDTHGNQDYASRPGLNVVYSETLSEAAILNALRAGHLYLSAGPTMTFEALDSNGARRMMGDTVKPPARLVVSWDDCPGGSEIRVMVNGRLDHQLPATAHGKYEWDMKPEQANWIVVEIRDKNGDMLAVTNPIFLKAPTRLDESYRQ